MNPEALQSGIGFPLFPPQASLMAGRVDRLFFTMIAITGLVTVLVAAVIVYSMFRFRRRSAALPRQVRGSIPLELTWTIVPLLIFVVPFVWGAEIYVDMYRAPADALQITGLSRQWMWKFEHPGGQREIDELHVPLGRPVRLLLTSEDVVHSFFIPAFRAKQDVLPGRYTTVWFEPSATGQYHLFCSEYCGTEHSHMRGSVTVMRPDEFERWLQRGASQSMASEGAKLFQQLGCNLCHRPDSLQRAPALEGLYGGPVQLTDGRIVVADETYLRESILDPAAKVVLGWQPIMPTFRGRVGEEQMLQIIAYLKSLGARAAVPPRLAPERQPLFPSPGGPVQVAPAPTR